MIVVDLRSRRPGSSLYLVTTPTGEGLAGNVGSLEPGVLDHPGWLETNYRRLDAPEGSDHRALVQVVQLPGGFHLLVGRDLEERERLFGIIPNAGRWSFALVDRARARRRLLRQPARAQAHRRHDRHGANHHGGRSHRPLAGRRNRRRTRPSRGKRQRHARAHRSADARAQGSLRQYRARSQNAADAAAQPLRTGAAPSDRARATIAQRWRRPSRNPTILSAPSTRY